MKIEAVFFDLDDTLVVDEVVSKEAFAATAQAARERHGAEPEKFARTAQKHARELWQAGPAYPFAKEIGISAFEGLWGGFVGETGDLRKLREFAHAYRAQVFDHALREQMIESLEGGQDLAESFGQHRRRLQRLMPDAREVLVRLGAKYKLGLLTNGAPDLQREKIAASGLGDLFQAIAVSGERGIGKPRPEIFHQLAAELGVAPAAAVMVGNSKERDIAGAINAGLTSVWLKVAGSEEHAEVEPTHTITGLAELPALLEKIEA